MTSFATVVPLHYSVTLLSCLITVVDYFRMDYSSLFISVLRDI